MLYQADLRRIPASGVLASQERQRAADGQPPLNGYVATIVDGVATNADVIDAAIAQHAVGWTLERMPTVDRAILRIACFELLAGAGAIATGPDSEREADTSVPAAVVISEAVRLAGELSTDDSASFVNGVLGSLARDLAARPISVSAGVWREADDGPRMPQSTEQG